jgi:hypothetical protein
MTDIKMTDITMTAKKETNDGNEVTAKNVKKTAIDIATPTKTTTKKATTKTTSARKTTMTNATSIPAYLPDYEEYRLGDIVSSTKWREDDLDRESTLIEHHYYRKDGTVEIYTEVDEEAKETLRDYTFRMFPDSIAAQYLKKTKRINDINVLSDIVDEFATKHETPLPAADVMVMHLRVGDVIDGTDVPVREFFNRRVNSYFALFGIEPEGWSPVYVRCLESFDRALKKTKELGFHKIALVYGFHIGYSVKKSRQYLAGLRNYAHSQGFEVEMITHGDADVSFAYACNAKHFIPGGGGYSKLISKVVRHKGHSVYQVKV